MTFYELSIVSSQSAQPVAQKSSAQINISNEILEKFSNNYLELGTIELSRGSQFSEQILGCGVSAPYLTSRNGFRNLECISGLGWHREVIRRDRRGFEEGQSRSWSADENAPGSVKLEGPARRNTVTEGVHSDFSHRSFQVKEGAEKRGGAPLRGTNFI